MSNCHYSGFEQAERLHTEPTSSSHGNSGRPSDNALHLFDLPREIRDQIYSYIHTDTRVKCKSWTWQHQSYNCTVTNGLVKGIEPGYQDNVYVRYGPVKGMLYVNHQFGSEYLEQTSKSMELVIVGKPHQGLSLYPTLPEQLCPLVHNVISYFYTKCTGCPDRCTAGTDDFDGMFGSCKATTDLDYQCSLLMNSVITKLPNLKSLQLRPMLMLRSRHSYSDFDWPASPHVGLDSQLIALVDLKAVSSMTVALGRRSNDYRRYHQRRGAVMGFATWDRSTDWTPITTVFFE